MLAQWLQEKSKFGSRVISHDDLLDWILNCASSIFRFCLTTSYQTKSRDSILTKNGLDLFWTEVTSINFVS